MRKFLSLILFLMAGLAIADSTINPSVPIANSPLASAPLRTNFMSAYTDINNILSKYAGTVAPPSPSKYQYWLDTTLNPSTLKMYDGASWVAIGKLDASAHTWSTVGSYIGTPVSTAFGGTGKDMSASSGAISVTAGVATAGALPASYLATALDFTGKTITAGTFNSAVLATPSLGTPSSGVITNLTGTAINITAGYVINNANLSGVITSIGNTTSIATQTGTGSKFVVDTNPVLITPNIGTPSAGVVTNLTGTASGMTAGHVTTNANMTGVITSIGNATSIATQTGTGTKFVVDTSPTLVTPEIGLADAGYVTFSGSAVGPAGSRWIGTAGGTAFFINAPTGATTTIGVNNVSIAQFLSTGVAITGALTVSTGGGVSTAACWKSDGITLGKCSSVVGAGGGCTCN